MALFWQKIDNACLRLYDYLMPDLRFDLEDDLSITELRNVDQWQPRLAKAGKLRVQRHGAVVGVLLSPDEWKAMKEQIENARDRELIADRSGAKVLSGRKLRSALEKELKEAGLL